MLAIDFDIGNVVFENGGDIDLRKEKCQSRLVQKEPSVLVILTHKLLVQRVEGRVWTGEGFANFKKC